MVDAETLPDLGVIVVWPAPTIVARPFPLIVATVLSEESQNTYMLMFCTSPLSKVPVAVNWTVAPTVPAGFVGLRSIDTSVLQLPAMLDWSPRHCVSVLGVQPASVRAMKPTTKT